MPSHPECRVKHRWCMPVASGHSLADANCRLGRGALRPQSLPARNLVDLDEAQQLPAPKFVVAAVIAERETINANAEGLDRKAWVVLRFSCVLEVPAQPLWPDPGRCRTTSENSWRCGGERR